MQFTPPGANGFAAAIHRRAATHVMHYRRSNSLAIPVETVQSSVNRANGSRAAPFWLRVLSDRVS